MFIFFYGEGGFERTECERRLRRMQRARRTVPQQGEMSRRKRGEIEPLLQTWLVQKYDTSYMADEYFRFRAWGLSALTGCTDTKRREETSTLYPKANTAPKVEQVRCSFILFRCFRWRNQSRY